MKSEVRSQKSEQAGFGQFNKNGFEILADVLPLEKCGFLANALSVLHRRQNETAKNKLGGLRNLLRILPQITELANSFQFKTILKNQLNKKAFPVRALFFDKTADANWRVAWHQDLTIAVVKKRETPEFEGWSIKEGIVHVQPQRKMVYVALGSNLGDSRRIILDAMTRLQNFSDAPILKSSLWQTSPVDCPSNSPKFVNAIIGLAPQKNETPESLLIKLRGLEREFGRAPKKVLNEPRPLDLDLIAFGSETRDTKELILPHPRTHLRRFVLQPLSEIAPDLILPGQRTKVSQWLAGLPGDETVTRL